MSDPKPGDRLGTGAQDLNSSPINRELIEHRITELECNVREVKNEVASIHQTLTEVKTTIEKGLATRTQLLYSALGMVGVLVVLFLTVYFQATKS